MPSFMSPNDVAMLNSEDSILQVLLIKIVILLFASTTSRQVKEGKKTKKRQDVDPDAIYQCFVCSYSTNKQYSLNRHIARHRKGRQFTCNDCGRNFARKETLRTHINTHTGDKPYPCDLCPERFSHPYTRYLHKRNHSLLE